jgi:hypothetical protein
MWDVGIKGIGSANANRNLTSNLSSHNQQMRSGKWRMLTKRAREVGIEDIGEANIYKNPTSNLSPLTSQIGGSK